jgi:ElaB/YqjD/DUF883 family membrane-anchored ribosome-binding protein
MSDTGRSNADTAASTNSGAGSSGGGNDEAGRLAGVRQSAADAYSSALERTSSAYSTARERAGSAFSSAADTARSAGQKTAQGIDSNPMAAIVGGLALGAIAGALLPKTQREQELLGPAGRKITGTAKEAVRAAKEAGQTQLADLGLTKDGVRQKLDQFTEQAVGAVKSTAGAAASGAKSTASGGGNEGGGAA